MPDEDMRDDHFPNIWESDHQRVPGDFLYGDFDMEVIQDDHVNDHDEAQSINNASLCANDDVYHAPPIDTAGIGQQHFLNSIPSPVTSDMDHITLDATSYNQALHDPQAGHKLVPKIEFTAAKVAADLDIPVDMRKNFEKYKYRRVFLVHERLHALQDEGAVELQNEDGEVSTFGCGKIHVKNHEKWDTTWETVGIEMSRKQKGKTAKQPVAAVYEIFKYCGMEVDRTYKNSRILKLNKDNKKSLLQDAYVFKAGVLAKNKKRVRGW